MSPDAIAVQGEVGALTPEQERILFDRSTARDRRVAAGTAAIIEAVRTRGDAALLELAAQFDRVELTALEVPKDRWTEARARLDPAVDLALQRAARNIATVHEAFRPGRTEVSPEPGIRIGRRPDPLERVGVYAPGGRAAYPSSVLMCTIPARVAGVGEVIVCSPPSPSGTPSDAVLAAALIAGADRVFAIGGAGAVAAMALGTATVPRVDRIVGPGNAYVAEAKLQLAGEVGIDTPAGPSELLVVADHTARPEGIAAEMLAQAEHDPETAVVLVALGTSVARAVAGELNRQIDQEPRADIIRTALARRGGIVVASSLEEAIRFAARFAPEHLLLALDNASAVQERFRNAGTIFVGESASVSFGDYLTGANHVLPTGALARSYSGLSTLDFVRWTTYQSVTPAAAAALAADTAIFATAEALPGHARAAARWRAS